MPSNIEKYKGDLKKLILKGDFLCNAIKIECHPHLLEDMKNRLSKKEFADFQKNLPSFKGEYQAWYSESLSLVKQILPDRLTNFVGHFEKPKARKDITYGNYVIEDYLIGLNVTFGYEKKLIVGPSAAIPQFEQQLNIVKALERKFESSLFDIKLLVQADLFDSELDAAKELLKNKFFRAAGALAGVVLEKHLKQVILNHNLVLQKKNATINDCNELLKQNEVIEIAQWRFIQHLGDIRNLCDHDKKKEPSSLDIDDLIKGVDKITKTIF